MAQTTVLALFKDKRDAEAAVRALKSARFDSARLGVVDPGKAHVQAFGKMAVAGGGGGAAPCGELGAGVGIPPAGGGAGAPRSAQRRVGEEGRIRWGPR